MAGSALPTNLDSVYPDSGTDASVQLHQAYHDATHKIVNLVDKDTLPSATLPVWVFNSGTGLMVPRALLSTDLPTIVNETITGTTYTFVLGDAGKRKRTTNVAAVGLTVPPNSSVAFPIGTQLMAFQYGTGQITWTEGLGVTLRSYLTMKKSLGQFCGQVATKIAVDEWELEGPLAA